MQSAQMNARARRTYNERQMSVSALSTHLVVMKSLPTHLQKSSTTYLNPEDHTRRTSDTNWVQTFYISNCIQFGTNVGQRR